MKFATALAATVSLVSACAAPTPARVAPSSSRAPTSLERAFPAPRAALEVPAQGASLEQLLTQLSVNSGVNFAFDAQAKDGLASTKLNLTQPLVLAPDEACAWIESQLVSSGFVMSFDPHVTPTTLRVLRKGTHDLAAVSIESEEFEVARQHPALLVQLTLTLPHTDVRTLQSTLRPLMGNEVSAILPVGNTQTVVVQGTGQRVAQIVELLRNADEQARLAIGGQDPRRPAAPAQAPVR